MILGIDPALRHTGLCLRKQAGPIFRTITTPNENCPSADIVSTTRYLRSELTRIFTPMKGVVTTVALERQLSVGGRTSSMQFLAQSIALEAIVDCIAPEHIIMPLPQQLNSWYKKRGIDISTDSATVREFKERTGYKPRVSIHCVDAYFLTEIAQEVLDGRWEYKLPSKEVDLIPGVITNGASLNKSSSR